MPAPKVRDKERSRTKKGKWRKKRSDSGKKRTKLPRQKHAISHLLGIPKQGDEKIMPLRKCKSCGLEASTYKELELFAKQRNMRFGRKNFCKSCERKRLKTLRESTELKLDGFVYKKCNFCGLEVYTKEKLELFQKNKLAKFGRGTTCKKCHNKYQRIARARIRLIVLKHYGGVTPKCACCGEKRIEFLSIDHIDGNGNKHIKQIRKEGYRYLYYWLYKHDFPIGFRVLCLNCNLSLGHYGYCPHQIEQKPPLCEGLIDASQKSR